MLVSESRKEYSRQNFEGCVPIMNSFRCIWTCKVGNAVSARPMDISYPESSLALCETLALPKSNQSKCVYTHGNTGPEGDGSQAPYLNEPHDLFQRIAKDLDVKDIVLQSKLAVWGLNG